MTEKTAKTIQPGDVLIAEGGTWVVGSIRPTGIACPLFRLETIGAEKPHPSEPGWTSYRLCALPEERTTAPYRGGLRYTNPGHPTPYALSGAELARRRKALGLSQTALADALGLTQATISRYETETRDIEQPKLIARAMRDVEREYARADADYDASRDQADAERPPLPAIDEAF